MLDMNLFKQISPCEYADALPREQFIDYQISSLWPQPPRIAGPAFTVFCEDGDHLMMHAAIYEASPGDIIVVKSDPQFACAGGNVCAIAKKRGIAGFVIDGVVRDLAETRDIQFPVFARGVIPYPAAKKAYSPLNQTIQCGGVTVNPGDIVIADEEGIAVVPREQAQSAYEIARARTDKDEQMTLEQWQDEHKRKIDSIIAKQT
ncbi:RraA family protein [Aliiglaciecola lipolytica]|uniref:Putative 4-hydroxy-4-methyl-2-oxoglutarate aldolase n=1 Tax=Aliiglaciecola lipolytica E3 TaxID=1127673 RepID=K6Y5S5_9ALTE|nr:RraA family protein [Aliiglaciecola lipolytica]GAC13592.1 conserved domain protein [Aliiglaciecola lipolytica E3]